MTDEQTRLESVDGETTVLETLEADVAHLTTSAIASAQVTDLTAETSALGMVNATNAASATWSVAGVLASNAEASLSQGSAGIVFAGGNATLSQGGAEVVVAAGDVHMDRSGAGVVAARSVSITQGWVGVIASPEAQVAEGVTVLFGPRQAIAAGAAFGAVFAAVFALFVGASRRR